MTSSDGSHSGSMPDDSAGRLRERFQDYGDFVARCGPYLCAEGMFLHTELPPTAGSVIRFRLELEDGVTLVQGRGEVLWERLDAPIGIGLRFVELDPLSRELVGRIIGRRRGPPFDLGAGPQAIIELPVVPFDEPAVVVHAEEAVEAGGGGFEPEVEPELVPEIFVPPELPPLLERTGSGQLEVAEPLRRTKRGFRLSPSALVLVLLAGITGGATYFLLETIATRIAGADAGAGAEADPLAPQIIDLPPLGVRPSRRSPREGGGEAGPDLVELSTLVVRAVDASEEPLPEVALSPLDSLTTESSPDEQAGPLSQVRRVTWKEVDGDTLVTLWGDGVLQRADLSSYRIGGDQPRELIKIRGVDWPLREPILLAATADLRQIRSGFHPKPELNELHLVFDLTGPAVHLSSIEVDGLTTHLLFSRR